jgi:FXSXX-COOH protein
MSDPSSHIGEIDVRQELIDVNGIPLDHLVTSDDTVLNRAIRRLVHDLGRATEDYSAFGSSTP